MAAKSLHSVFQFNTSVGIFQPGKALIDWERRETITKELSNGSVTLTGPCLCDAAKQPAPAKVRLMIILFRERGNYPKANARDGWLQMVNGWKPGGALITAAMVRTRWKQREGKFWSQCGWISHCVCLLEVLWQWRSPGWSVLLWYRAIQGKLVYKDPQSPKGRMHAAMFEP